MRFSLSLLFSLLLLALSVQAEHAVDSSEVYFQARSAFEQSEFARAVDIMEQAVEQAPGNPEYQLWLGRSYGRLAEQSPWYRAVGLAKKTRKAFERAVELKPDYLDALEDLISYYRAAPAIVGGSEEKAEVLQKRVDAIQARSHTLSVAPANHFH